VTDSLRIASPASAAADFHRVIRPVVIFAWIGLNSVALLSQPFDPYPYILLNLVLSTLAALQAPVIMMSQNRQELVIAPTPRTTTK